MTAYVRRIAHCDLLTCVPDKGSFASISRQCDYFVISLHYF